MINLNKISSRNRKIWAPEFDFQTIYFRCVGIIHRRETFHHFSNIYYMIIKYNNVVFPHIFSTILSWHFGLFKLTWMMIFYLLWKNVFPSSLDQHHIEYKWIYYIRFDDQFIINYGKITQLCCSVDIEFYQQSSMWYEINEIEKVHITIYLPIYRNPIWVGFLRQYICYGGQTLCISILKKL